MIWKKNGGYEIIFIWNFLELEPELELKIANYFGSGSGQKVRLRAAPAPQNWFVGTYIQYACIYCSVAEPEPPGAVLFCWSRSRKIMQFSAPTPAPAKNSGFFTIIEVNNNLDFPSANFFCTISRWYVSKQLKKNEKENFWSGGYEIVVNCLTIHLEPESESEPEPRRFIFGGSEPEPPKIERLWLYLIV